jgi:pimeloyl-ACP methyl ester carboxylesterase
MANAPVAIVPVGISTQREVDALFSDTKHFTANNTHKAKVATGVTLEYALHTLQVDDAEGEERVTFLMGFMEDKESWAPMVDLIQHQWLTTRQTKNLTMVTLDNRGCGGSSAGWGYNSTSIMANDALALLDHLGWDKVHIIGLSMGGMIALELATMAPQRLRSLSLIVTTRGGFETSGATNFILQTVFTRDQEAILQMTLDFFYPKEFLAKPLEGSTETVGDVLRRLHKDKMTNMKPQTVGGYVGQTLAIRTHFVSDERLAALGKAGVPIMVMGCAGDKLIPGVESVKIRDAIGAEHVRLVYYDKAAHCVVRQAPGEVAQELFANIIGPQ